VSTLLLVLAGPMQSWGSASRFSHRTTERFPTKSAVLGLVAAAEGRRRCDPVEDLTRLRFGVRIDQPGRVAVDYHTARPARAKDSMLSYRSYLQDAVFLAGLEGPEPVLAGIRDALRSPRFLPFLGRRSCPPARPVLEGLVPESLEEALADHPWRAGPATVRRATGPVVRLPLVLDLEPGHASTERVRDIPLSFDPAYREFGWRDIRRCFVDVRTGLEPEHEVHDPMAILGGA
jgi:CRISPR system Cascade subunit CasD